MGGANNVPTFVALIGARTNLNVAVLIDFQKKDQQFVENLYKSKLLKKQNVLTFADYIVGSEADIEDMFDPELYLKLVNSEFNSSLGLSDLPMTHPRILNRLEQHLESTPLSGGVPFNHYRPARYFSENTGLLGAELSDETLDRFQKAFDELKSALVGCRRIVCREGSCLTRLIRDAGVQADYRNAPRSNHDGVRLPEPGRRAGAVWCDSVGNCGRSASALSRS